MKVKAKEVGREIGALAIAAILANPIVLFIITILFLIVLIAGLWIIIAYNLVTAITLFILSTLTILALHYLKAIDLTEQPSLALAPLIMGLIGYIAERIKIFQIQPLWTTQIIKYRPQQTQPIIILLIFLFFIWLLLRRKK